MGVAEHIQLKRPVIYYIVVSGSTDLDHAVDTWRVFRSSM